MENRIAFQLSADEQKKINDALQVIFETLQPHTVVLTDQDRHNIPKMADGTLPFVEKSMNYMTTNPEFKPDFVEINDFNIDLNGYKLGNSLLSSVYRLARLLEDISILSGSEAYMAALAYFNSVKFYAKMNRVGAKVVHEDLQQRFLSPNRKGNKTPPSSGN